MALKATVYKAELQISDLNRHYYATHALTVAQHPSENDERLMVRLLAFALHASETLTFTKGLSETDEPDLWQKDLTDAVELWVELGMPDEKRLRRACSRAEKVAIYAYHGKGTEIWWQGLAGKVHSLQNLAIIQIPQEQSQALAKLAGRSMRLQATLEDEQIWFGDERETLTITPIKLKEWA